MMSLQSALLGYAIFLILPKLLPQIMSKPFTPAENVILQTTAVATGTMPLAAGLVGIIPALEMLDIKLDGKGPIRLSWTHLIMWCMAVAFFGVFLAVPLRRQVIVKEKLVFPSGTATAQLIALLHKAPPPTETLSSDRTGAGPYRRLPRDSVEDLEEDIGPAGPGRKEEKQEVMGGSGWKALGWSFAASGALTVSHHKPYSILLRVWCGVLWTWAGYMVREQIGRQSQWVMR